MDSSMHTVVNHNHIRTLPEAIVISQANHLSLGYECSCFHCMLRLSVDPLMAPKTLTVLDLFIDIQDAMS